MKTTETTETTQIAILSITPLSKVDLKIKVGSLTCLDLISKKEVTVKFKKGSALYNMLSGYSILKFLYKKTRLVAVEMNEKSEATVLVDKELTKVEKKYKKFMNDWTVLFKNSLGVK